MVDFSSLKDLCTRSAVSIVDEDWSDEIFKTKFFEPGQSLIPKLASTNQGNICSALKQFWMAYIGVKLPLSARDWFRICGTILSACESFQELYGSHGTNFSINGCESTLNTVIWANVKKMGENGGYTPNEIALVQTMCIEYGDGDEFSRESFEVQSKLLYTALHISYLTRLHRKKPAEYENSFNKNAANALSNLVMGPTNWSPLLPGEDFIKISQNLYGTSVNESCWFLAQLVACVTIMGKDQPHNHKMKAILRAGCLVSLERVGLGLFGWVLRACEAVDKGPEVILPYLYFDSTESSITTLTTWNDELKTNPCETIGFARCMGDQYLIKLSTKRHPFLCFILACIVLGDAEARTLVSMSLKPVMRDTAAEIADIVKRELVTPGQSEARHEKSRMVLSKLNPRFEEI